MNETELKNLLKEHLKVKTEFINPNNFFNGCIKTTIYWDNDPISKSVQEVKRSFF